MPDLPRARTTKPKAQSWPVQSSVQLSVGLSLTDAHDEDSSLFKAFAASNTFNKANIVPYIRCHSLVVCQLNIWGNVCS